jgi:CubicO group peptidase (beta-lactamase class C family)
MWLVWLVSAVVACAQDTARMEAVVKAQTAGDRYMGNVLVVRDGVTLFSGSYGWANLEWKVPHTPTSKFRIGSVTKQFTAAAILLLEERGKLKVGDLVSKYVPATPDAWKDVTVHHLLSHTSGVPSFTDLPDYKKWQVLGETPAQTMVHIRDLPLDFAPGEKFKYSNTGYTLLGWIVEIVSGQSYETFSAGEPLHAAGHERQRLRFEHRDHSPARRRLRARPGRADQRRVHRHAGAARRRCFVFDHR